MVLSALAGTFPARLSEAWALPVESCPTAAIRELTVPSSTVTVRSFTVTSRFPAPFPSASFSTSQSVSETSMFPADANSFPSTLALRLFTFSDFIRVLSMPSTDTSIEVLPLGRKLRIICLTFSMPNVARRSCTTTSSTATTRNTEATTDETVRRNFIALIITIVLLESNQALIEILCIFRLS